jgi:hypothetical protein
MLLVELKHPYGEREEGGGSVFAGREMRDKAWPVPAPYHTHIAVTRLRVPCHRKWNPSLSGSNRNKGKEKARVCAKGVEGVLFMQQPGVPRVRRPIPHLGRRLEGDGTRVEVVSDAHRQILCPCTFARVMGAKPERLRVDLT